jgi:uncharacterized tellurite resistance protein B-like protein
MGFLQQLFSRPAGEDPDHSAALDEVEAVLTGLPEPDAARLACIALLMADVAYADMEVAPGEKENIQEVLAQQMRLPADQAEKVAAIALDSAQKLAIERYLLLRKLNEVLSHGEKIQLVRTLFHVACAGDISEAESDEIGAIASALLLARSEYLAVRSEFNEYRSILKNLP